MCLVSGPEIRHDSLTIVLTDNGVSLVIASSAGAIANKTRKDDSVERSVIFAFHADIPKAGSLYQKWVMCA